MLYFFTDVDSNTVDRGLAVLAGDGDEGTGRQHFINVRSLAPLCSRSAFFTRSNHIRASFQTKCPHGHDIAALCCKTDAELRFFLREAEADSNRQSVWCHFDDGKQSVSNHFSEATCTCN